MSDLRELLSTPICDDSGMPNTRFFAAVSEVGRRMIAVSEAVNESLNTSRPPKLAWRIRRILDGREHA